MNKQVQFNFSNTWWWSFT